MTNRSLNGTLFILFISYFRLAFAVDWNQCPAYRDFASVHSETPSNEAILTIVKKIKFGGGYDLKWDMDNEPGVETLLKAKGPSEVSVLNSMCSSATYLVYLAYLKEKGVSIARLAANDEKDGIGPWGHWNANATGAATFLSKVDGGRNFTEVAKSQAGDFAKLFFGDRPETVQFGNKEHGHLVVFLGCKEDLVCYWSSNLPKTHPRPQDDQAEGGIGAKCIPKNEVQYVVFSRVNNKPDISKLSALADSSSPAYRDPKLISYERDYGVQGAEAINREIAPLLRSTIDDTNRRF